MINRLPYENPALPHIHRLPARAHYIPYGSAEEKKEEKNSRAVLLNGDWDFAYFLSPLDLPEKPEDVVFRTTIPVPSSFECFGYGQKNYTNINYPIPFNPPLTPKDNPVAVYRKGFTVPKDAPEKTYILFDGVSSYLEVYVNGQFVGMSKGSHSPAEFDLSSFIRGEENVLICYVYTLSDATYLEDQDFFRYHGIFRDVTLFFRPANHLRDFFVHTGNDGTIKVDADFTGTPFPLCGTVEAPDGREYPLTDGRAKVPSPLLWTAETPYLYTLSLTAGDEFIQKKIGFRTVSVSEKGELLINGQSVKIKGVNRHDSSPKTGYTVTYEEMKRDLLMMKAHNINAVRTSHYPNAPVFPELC
ncbi:MAG: hypothetical protein MJ078_02045, partial [Clostridia bacterium]|nr:hypothetical protein [Clostridia bacterium]